MLSVLFVIYYLFKYNYRAPPHEEPRPPSIVSQNKAPSIEQDVSSKVFYKSLIDLRKNILFDKMSAATLPELLETHPPSGEGDGDDLPLPVNPIIRRRSSSKTHTRYYRIRLPPNPRRAKR